MTHFLVMAMIGGVIAVSALHQSGFTAPGRSALTVMCDTCLAVCGEQCVSEDGNRTTTHRARRRLAAQLGQIEEAK
jgi:hypothetical protein